MAQQLNKPIKGPVAELLSVIQGSHRERSGDNL